MRSLVQLPGHNIMYTQSHPVPMSMEAPQSFQKQAKRGDLAWGQGTAPYPIFLPFHA